MRLMSSTLTAETSVKLLMAIHEINQVAARKVCFWRNESPYVAGQNDPTMKRTVRISRWIYPSA